MSFKATVGFTGVRRVLNSNVASSVSLVFINIFLLSMSISTSSAAQIVSSSIETKEIDGRGIINTPNHNSSSPLWNIPFVDYAQADWPLPIGRFCEADSDCGNFSVCRLVLSDQDTTQKICECDSQEMTQVNGSCYVKPGHQCYFPNKNEHGYTFIQCFPGSVCKSSVNNSAPRNGYCMCSYPPLEDRYRTVDVNFEMARCSAPSMLLDIGSYEKISWMMTLSVHILLKLLRSF